MRPNKVDAIGFLLLVGLVTLGYFGLIHRQARQLSAIKEEVAKLTLDSHANEGLENALAQDEADLDTARRRLEQAARGLVARKEIEGFLRRFASQAETLGVTVTLLRPGDTKKGAYCEFTPITLHLEGKFPGIFRLVEGLESDEAIAAVENMMVQSEPDNALCRVDVIVNLYMKPDKGT